MNGWCHADAVGAATFVAPSGHLVLDLVLVPANTTAYMSAAGVECDLALYHQAVAMTLYNHHSKSKHISDGIDEHIQVVSHQRAAWIWLSWDQASTFCKTDWANMCNEVQACIAQYKLPDQVLEVLEKGFMQ